MVVSQALGGPKSASSDPKDPERRDVTQGAATIDQAIAAMNQMLRVG